MYEDIGHSNEARKTMKKYLVGSYAVRTSATQCLSTNNFQQRRWNSFCVTALTGHLTTAVVIIDILF